MISRESERSDLQTLNVSTPVSNFRLRDLLHPTSNSIRLARVIHKYHPSKCSSNRGYLCFMSPENIIYRVS